MGMLDLLMVAFMPPLQVLLVATLGAFLASDYCRIFTADGRRNLNLLVFYVFTPSLVFATLVKTITLQDILSWWFMPVNIGITFFCGSLLGWLVVRILRPERHLEGLIIAVCSAGNLGNLMVIIIPAVCDEEGSPFGNPSICRPLGLSYASFSMALGGFYLWTHTYSLMKSAGALLHRDNAIKSVEEGLRQPASNVLGPDPDDGTSPLLSALQDEVSPQGHVWASDKTRRWWQELRGGVRQVAKECLQPPSCSAMVGLIVGAVPWLKSLIVGGTAPFRVVEDSIKLLGDATIPSVILILGGNLTKGMRKSSLRHSVVVAVMAVRYVVLPLVGIGVVKGAAALGLLPQDPLFSYVLMTQFTVPPATNIGTMAELFDVGQEECSFLFLWAYLAAAAALTLWSTVYMWLLS